MDQALWGTDSTPSLPEPPQNTIWVDLGGGFVFTSGGIAHNIDAATLEELATPPFAPMVPEVRPTNGK